MNRAKQFRTVAARENQGRQRTGWRYSEELRSLAAEHCRRQRQAGRPLAKIAEELGVSTLTLNRWLETSSEVGFRPVAVIPDTGDTDSDDAVTLSAMTPGGLRIEGLSWSQALELARAFR